jgi:protein gp37
MGDMFGDWMIDRRNWIRDIIGVVYDNPQHTFQFLTKYPQNLNHLIGDDIFTLIRPNMWIGTSVTVSGAQGAAQASHF